MCFESSSAPETPQEIKDMYKLMNKISGEQYAYQKEKYRPLEDKLIDEAKRFNTPEYAQEQQGLAEADVTRKFADVRKANDINLASMGVDPGQAKYRGIQRAENIAEAGAGAAAGTTARVNAQQTGFNVLAGLAGRADAKIASSINAAQVGGNIANTAQANANAAQSSANSSNSSAMSGIGTLVGTGMMLF
jgi:hypothetical protein